MAHESRVTARVHSLLPKTDLIADKLRVDQISGYPDAYYSGPATDHWIEYKRIPEPPARETTVLKPDLRPAQKTRLKRQEDFGRSQWVVLYIDSTTTFVVFRTSEAWEQGATLDAAESYSNYKDFAALLYEHVVGRPLEGAKPTPTLKPPRIFRGNNGNS